MWSEAAFGKREVRVFTDGHDEVLLHLGSRKT
jgi:hypothetical protein